jgi:hypothetical protein
MVQSGVSKTINVSNYEEDINKLENINEIVIPYEEIEFPNIYPAKLLHDFIFDGYDFTSENKNGFTLKEILKCICTSIIYHYEVVAKRRLVEIETLHPLLKELTISNMWYYDENNRKILKIENQLI